MVALGLRCCPWAFSGCSKQGLFSDCGARVSHCGGFASLLLVAELHGFSSCGAHCPVACGILPERGSNPCPLHWQTDASPLGHQASPQWLRLDMARRLYAIEGIREAALELCVEIQKVSVTGGGREVVVGQHEGSGEAWGTFG